MGAYRVGADVIKFGRGQTDHEVINISGHTYQRTELSCGRQAAGSIFTGYTPFRNVITVRSV